MILGGGGVSFTKAGKIEGRVGSLAAALKKQVGSKTSRGIEAR